MTRRNEFERGLIRTDRGVFVDKGNYSVDPRHPDFNGGAKGDGVNDDGVAFNLARAHLPTEGGTIIVGPGDYFLDTAFTYGSQDNVVLWLMPGVVLTGESLPADADNNFLLDFRSGNIGSAFGSGGTGTTDRITVVAGVIDIASGYVGQTSITTLGTIATGAVPASLVTAGTFGAGNYTAPANLVVTGTFTAGTYTGQTSIVTLGTIATGAIPASLVTAGAFGTGSYTFDTNLTITGQLVASGATHSIAGVLGIGDTTPNGTLHVKAASSATIRIESSGESANEKTWRYGAFGATLQFQANSDDYLSGNVWMQVNRTGIVVDDIILTGTTIALAGRVGLGSAGTSPGTAVLMVLSTTSVSSLRIPHGAAPTSPANGDMWTTTSGLFVEINDSTVGPFIDSAGAAAAGTLTGTTLASNVVTTSITGLGILGVLVVSQPNSATHAASLVHSHSSAPLGILVNFTGDAPDDTTQYFLRMDDTAGIQAVIYSDGSYQGSANSYGALSDRRIKRNITPKASNWAAYKQLEWVDFELIQRPGKARVGLIAQDVRTLFPDHVYESTDALAPEKDPVLGINYMGMATETGRVVRELMDRIEVLEARPVNPGPPA